MSETHSGGASEEEEEETCLIDEPAVPNQDPADTESEAAASKVHVREGSGSTSSSPDSDKNLTRHNRRVSPAMADGEGDKLNPLLHGDVLNLAKTIMDVSKEDGQFPSSELDQLALHQVKLFLTLCNAHDMI